MFGEALWGWGMFLGRCWHHHALINDSMRYPENMKQISLYLNKRDTAYILDQN